MRFHPEAAGGGPPGGQPAAAAWPPVREATPEPFTPERPPRTQPAEQPVLGGEGRRGKALSPAKSKSPAKSPVLAPAAEAPPPEGGPREPRDVTYVCEFGCGYRSTFEDVTKHEASAHPK